MCTCPCLKMGILSNLLWMLAFHSIIHQVQAYVNGLSLVSSCNSMRVIHINHLTGNQIPPQTEDLFPFEVKIINTGHDLVTVTLGSTNSRSFRGFLLAASKNGTDRTVGKFLNLDSQSVLLNCNGLPGSGVSQRDNRRKTSISVTWTSEVGDVEGVIFRATFVESYDTFWNLVEVAIPSPQPSTAPSTTKTGTDTTAITTKPEASIIPSPSDPFTTTFPANTTKGLRNHVRMYSPQVTCTVFLSSLVLIVPLSFPNNAKCHNINKWMRIVGSVLTVLLSTSALVLVKDSLNRINIGALMVTGVLTFFLLICGFLKIGRSHELKSIYDIIFGVLLISQKALAIAVIYNSTKQCKHWHQKVLISFTVCIGLQIIYYFVIVCMNKTGMQIPQVCIAALVTILTFGFCVAIIVGICLC